MEKMSAATESTVDRREKLRCDMCGRIFDNLDILNFHKQLEHSESARGLVSYLVSVPISIFASFLEKEVGS